MVISHMVAVIWGAVSVCRNGLLRDIIWGVRRVSDLPLPPPIRAEVGLVHARAWGMDDYDFPIFYKHKRVVLSVTCYTCSILH